MSIKSTLLKQDDFTKLEKQIANYFLSEQAYITHMTTRSIANALYTTPSKIVRFCQKMGFDGFSDFKSSYMNELQNESVYLDYNFPFHANDKTTQLSSKIGTLYHQHIDEVIHMIDHDSLNQALHLLRNAKSINIISSGVQSNIAKAFQDHMLKIGANVIIEDQFDLAYYRVCNAEPSTVYIVISYSGETPNTLKIVHKINQQKLPIIALTTKGNNTLSSLADVCLYLSTHETLIQNLGHFGTNISTLLILDILYAQYFNQNFQDNLQKRITITSSFQTKRKSNNPLLKD